MVLINNDLTWYVVTYENDKIKLIRAEMLSGILQCGHDPAEYGIADLEQCWNEQDLSR
jgi:hypothetical protein